MRLVMSRDSNFPPQGILGKRESGVVAGGDRYSEFSTEVGKWRDTIAENLLDPDNLLKSLKLL